MVPIDARGAQLRTERSSRMVLKTDTPPKSTFQPTPLRVRTIGAFERVGICYTACAIYPMAARLNVDRKAPRSAARVLLLYYACTTVAIFYAVARAAEAPPDWWVRLLPPWQMVL